MGYSPRYHVASLAAVFLALAVGIVIGVGFGDNVASDATRDLETSLTGDLDDARSQVDDLEADVAREQDFTQRVYPALVGDRLKNKEVALISLGSLSDEIATDIEDTLEPSGATLTAVGVLNHPPSREALADAIGPKAFAGLRRDDAALGRYATSVGRQIVTGGDLLRKTSRQLFGRVSGRIGSADAVIIYRSEPPTVEDQPEEESSAGKGDAEPSPDQTGDGGYAVIEEGLLNGLVATGVPVVGVERSSDEFSSIGLYASSGVPSVDNLDQVAGQVAAVFVLLGAEGKYGVKSSADRLLPDLLFSSGKAPGS